MNQLNTGLAIDPDDIAAAAARLQGVARRTPVFTSRTADERTGAQVFFKCENFLFAGITRGPQLGCLTPGARANVI